jgi:regulator of replication initiation timing
MTDTLEVENARLRADKARLEEENAELRSENTKLGAQLARYRRGPKVAQAKKALKWAVICAWYQRIRMEVHPGDSLKDRKAAQRLLAEMIDNPKAFQSIAKNDDLKDIDSEVDDYYQHMGEERIWEAELRQAGVVEELVQNFVPSPEMVAAFRGRSSSSFMWTALDEFYKEKLEAVTNGKGRR